MTGKRGPLEMRFWSKVRKTETCWLWQGSRDTSGYGQIGAGMAVGQLLSTHRYSFELATGHAPGDLHVLHRCDVRHCVNPSHLFLGTNADNIADKNAKGRNDSTVNEADVRLIRTEYAKGDITQESLARFFGLTQGNISRIVNAVTWAQK